MYSNISQYSKSDIGKVTTNSGIKSLKMATMTCDCTKETIERNVIQQKLYNIQLQNNSSKKIVKILMDSLRKKLESEEIKQEIKKKTENSYKSKTIHHLFPLIQSLSKANPQSIISSIHQLGSPVDEQTIQDLLSLYAYYKYGRESNKKMTFLAEYESLISCNVDDFINEISVVMKQKQKDKKAKDSSAEKTDDYIDNLVFEKSIEALDLELKPLKFLIRSHKKAVIDMNMSLQPEEMTEMLYNDFMEMKIVMNQKSVPVNVPREKNDESKVQKEAKKLSKILRELLENLSIADKNIDTLALSLDLEVSMNFQTDKNLEDDFEDCENFRYMDLIEMYELNKKIFDFNNSLLIKTQKNLKEHKWFEFSELMKFIKRRHDNLTTMNELLYELIRNFEDCNGNLIKNDHTRFVDN